MSAKGSRRRETLRRKKEEVEPSERHNERHNAMHMREDRRTGEQRRKESGREGEAVQERLRQPQVNEARRKCPSRASYVHTRSSHGPSYFRIGYRRERPSGKASADRVTRGTLSGMRFTIFLAQFQVVSIATACGD